MSRHIYHKLPGDTVIDLTKIVAIEPPTQSLGASKKSPKSPAELFTTDPAILDLQEVYGFRILMDGGHVVTVLRPLEEIKEVRDTWGKLWRALMQTGSFTPEK